MSDKTITDNHAKLLAVASAFAKFVDNADKASLLPSATETAQPLIYTQSEKIVNYKEQI